MPDQLFRSPAAPPAATGNPALRFVRRLLPDRSTGSPVTAPAAAGTTAPGAPMAVSVLGAELHRLSHAGSPATIHTHSGNPHPQMRVEAVHRRYARLADAGGHQLLMPRAFMHTVEPSAGGAAGGRGD
ncbi:hypothetical protein [Nocardia sp. NPDC057227]|uniref:hypothetical protein n=1 Tax=Nocardia sp. NPDC057227 TaxID=3346056 RepID=UPI0036326C2E